MSLFGFLEPSFQCGFGVVTVFVTSMNCRHCCIRVTETLGCLVVGRWPLFEYKSRDSGFVLSWFKLSKT